MNRLLGLGLFAGLLVAFMAIAADDKAKPKDDKTDKATHDSIAKEFVDVFTKMVAVLESAKDEKTAKEAKPKLAKVVEQLNALKDKAKKLGPIPPEEEKKLDEKYNVEMKIVFDKLAAEWARLKGQPFEKELKDVIDVKPKPAEKPADKPSEKKAG